MTQYERKAFKLIEALAEPCNEGRDGDHRWSRCRRCLAIQELDERGARELMRHLLALRDVWTTNVEPFMAWAQTYLDGGRWGGHDVFDAIKTELIERDMVLKAGETT
jgi:hypothetical protein